MGPRPDHPIILCMVKILRYTVLLINTFLITSRAWQLAALHHLPLIMMSATTALITLFAICMVGDAFVFSSTHHRSSSTHLSAVDEEEDWRTFRASLVQNGLPSLDNNDSSGGNNNNSDRSKSTISNHRPKPSSWALESWRLRGFSSHIIINLWLFKNFQTLIQNNHEIVFVALVLVSRSP